MILPNMSGLASPSSSLPVGPSRDYYAATYFNSGGVVSAIDGNTVRVALHEPVSGGRYIDALLTELPGPDVINLMGRSVIALGPNTDAGALANYTLKIAPFLVNRSLSTWQDVAHAYDALVRGTEIEAKGFPWSLLVSVAAAGALIGGGYYLYRKVR